MKKVKARKSRWNVQASTQIKTKVTLSIEGAWLRANNALVSWERWSRTIVNRSQSWLLWKKSKLVAFVWKISPWRRKPGWMDANTHIASNASANGSKMWKTRARNVKLKLKSWYTKICWEGTKLRKLRTNSKKLTILKTFIVIIVRRESMSAILTTPLKGMTMRQSAKIAWMGSFIGGVWSGVKLACSTRHASGSVKLAISTTPVKTSSCGNVAVKAVLAQKLSMSLFKVLKMKCRLGLHFLEIFLLVATWLGRVISNSRGQTTTIDKVIIEGTPQCKKEVQM